MMSSFKLVLGAKDGKSYQKEVKDKEANAFLAKKIGDKIQGDACGFPGYEFEITGGSDKAGFPMRKDVPGAVRKKILAIEGVGVKKHGHGQKQRKTVFGNTVSEQIVQINLKILKEGKEKLAKEENPEQNAAQKNG